MSQKNKHLFFMTGVTKDNKYEYKHVLAVNRQQAIQKFQEEYPELALCKIKPLYPRAKNSEAIKKAMIEKR